MVSGLGLGARRRGVGEFLRILCLGKDRRKGGPAVDKLLRDGHNWKLYRAVYEEPRYVEALDGRQNVWTIRNDQPAPCGLGIEIARGSRNAPTSDYDQAGAITIERFDDAAAFLLIWLQGLAGDTTVQVRLDDLRGLPQLHPAPQLVQPTVQVNGRTVTLPVRLDSLQALTAEGPGEIRFWPGGMQPSQPIVGATDMLMLPPGENRITFSADATAGYPGDINVLLYRLWPLP